MPTTPTAPTADHARRRARRRERPSQESTSGGPATFRPVGSAKGRSSSVLLGHHHRTIPRVSRPASPSKASRRRARRRRTTDVRRWQGGDGVGECPLRPVAGAPAVRWSTSTVDGRPWPGDRSRPPPGAGCASGREGRSRPRNGRRPGRRSGDGGTRARHGPCSDGPARPRIGNGFHPARTPGKHGGRGLAGVEAAGVDFADVRHEIGLGAPRLPQELGEAAEQPVVGDESERAIGIHKENIGRVFSTSQDGACSPQRRKTAFEKGTTNAGLVRHRRARGVHYLWRLPSVCDPGPETCQVKSGVRTGNMGGRLDRRHG